jgi:hypothetical protein
MAQVDAAAVARTPPHQARPAAAPLPPGRSEGRGAARVPAAEIPAITGVRLRPFGAEATLLNISASGVLVECVTRLRLGTAVTVVFDGTFTPPIVEGRVARSSVATVSKNGVLRYHVGIAFQKPIPLEVARPAPSVPAPQPAAPPPAPAAASASEAPAPAAAAHSISPAAATPTIPAATESASSAPVNRW